MGAVLDDMRWDWRIKEFFIGEIILGVLIKKVQYILEKINCYKYDIRDGHMT